MAGVHAERLRREFPESKIMSLALVHSRAREGVRAPAVQVEVHLSGGLPI
jgi:hypothetical protein